ncbi:MAG: hypothetical protein OXH04_06585 [Acidobacteria bacterium]|nr:hypothetical protein [Acidobacteriota bacterium]
MANEIPPGLADEWRLYEEHAAEWNAEHSGEFVVIGAKTEVLGFYKTYDEALRVGYARFGVAPFLAQLVQAPDAPAQFISRRVAPSARA